ncbi:MAG TPA: hypothetical protein VKZ46_03310 [Pedomonas sp.]|nr:hypothetical protein [Pedomonas sp.]
MKPLTLAVSTNDARILQLALRALRADRQRAPELANAICTESRAGFLRQMAADAEDCKVLHGRIDDLLNIRRSFSDADAQAAADRAALPATPAAAEHAIDSTGVITGNADLTSDWLPTAIPEAPAPLPVYPPRGGIEP